MKFFLAIAFCATLATVLAFSQHELKDKIKTAHDKCQTDPATAVDEAALKAYRDSKGQGTRPANLGENTLCVSKTLKWQNDDGSVNKEHLKERIAAATSGDAAKAEHIFTECAVEQANPIATAEHIHRCFFKHAKSADHR